MNTQKKKHEHKWDQVVDKIGEEIVAKYKQCFLKGCGEIKDNVIQQGLIAIKLNKEYEEYLNFLKKSEEGVYGLAYVHGWRCPQEIVNEGEERRKRIDKLKKQLRENI